MINYTNNQLAALWLNSIDRIPTAKKFNILKQAKEPFDLWANLEKFKEIVVGITDKDCYDILINSRDDKYLKELVKEISGNDAEIVTYGDENYPEMLAEIAQPPLVLYCKGNTDLLKMNIFAIVGTREPTRYGAEITRKFTEAIARSGFVTVSGMARGIDTVVHTVTLENNRPTIAVLGSGIDIVYPAENRQLYEKICKNGLVISEYRPKSRAFNFHFPERNRIISGLARGVLVTEGGINSGSMITVDCAIEQNRDVFIVPGNINSRQSMGCNAKLKQLQGAMVTDVNDILNEYNLPEFIGEKPEAIQLDYVEQLISNELEKGDLHFDELLNLTNLEVNNLNSLLTKMEIMGIIKKLPGNNYGL